MYNKNILQFLQKVFQISNQLMPNVVVFILQHYVRMERYMLGEIMTMGSVEVEIQVQEIWLQFLVLDLLILIAILGLLFNRLNVDLNILLLLMISEDYLHAEEVRMDNQDTVHLLMKLLQYMLVRYPIKLIIFLVEKLILLYLQ